MFGKQQVTVYGTGVIGEKGQVVIPAKAREKLKIKKGDNFIFFGGGPVVHMVKADELAGLLKEISANFSKSIADLKKVNK